LRWASTATFNRESEVGNIAKFKRNVAKYEIGEMRNQLSRDLQGRIEKVIDKEKARDQYYILVHAGLEAVSGTISTKLMVMNYMPPKMIGTILYHVDNKKGELKRLWIIPQDIPRSEEFVDYDTGLAALNEVHQSITDMPIIY